MTNNKRKITPLASSVPTDASYKPMLTYSWDEQTAIPTDVWQHARYADRVLFHMSATHVSVVSRRRLQ